MEEEKKEAGDFFESKTYLKLGLVFAFVVVIVIVYRKLKNENKI